MSQVSLPAILFGIISVLAIAGTVSRKKKQLLFYDNNAWGNVEEL